MRNDSLIFALVIMASFSPKDFRPTMEPPLTGNYYIPPPHERKQNNIIIFTMRASNCRMGKNGLSTAHC